jgi:hypothetical protein
MRFFLYFTFSGGREHRPVYVSLKHLRKAQRYDRQVVQNQPDQQEVGRGYFVPSRLVVARRPYASFSFLPAAVLVSTVHEAQ